MCYYLYTSEKRTNRQLFTSLPGAFSKIKQWKKTVNLVCLRDRTLQKLRKKIQQRFNKICERQLINQSLFKVDLMVTKTKNGRCRSTKELANILFLLAIFQTMKNWCHSWSKIQKNKNFSYFSASSTCFSYYMRNWKLLCFSLCPTLYSAVTHPRIESKVRSLFVWKQCNCFCHLHLKFWQISTIGRWVFVFC